MNLEGCYLPSENKMAHQEIKKKKEQSGWKSANEKVRVEVKMDKMKISCFTQYYLMTWKISLLRSGHRLKLFGRDHFSFLNKNTITNNSQLSYTLVFTTTKLNGHSPIPSSYLHTFIYTSSSS